MVLYNLTLKVCKFVSIILIVDNYNILALKRYIFSLMILVCIYVTVEFAPLELMNEVTVKFKVVYSISFQAFKIIISMLVVA